VAHVPRVSGREAVRVFATVGYEEVRQRGSHIRLRDAEGVRPPLTVPDHRELKTGLLHRLIRDAGMTVEEFVAAMK
jgi:predicted RNA binding protein YcfA (HicA-like mRNA interferase family)